MSYGVLHPLANLAQKGAQIPVQLIFIYIPILCDVFRAVESGPTSCFKFN